MLASPNASAAKTQSTIIETRRAAKESAMISSMVCTLNITCSLLISFNTFRILSVKNRLDEAKFRCFPVKRTLRRQECTPRRSGGERTVYLSRSTKRFPPSCCFASRRQRSNETDAGRQVQRKLLAAGPANHTRGSRNRHGGDWLPGRPQGEGFRNPESGFCDRCGDVLRV